MTPDTPRRNALVRFLALSVALAAGTIAMAAINPFGLFGDDLSFYCGSAALLHGADPYLHVSIFSCERDVHAWFLPAHEGIKVSLPAVWPPYALLAYVPFALLSFGTSLTLWLLLNIVAAASAAERLRVALTNVSAWLIYALVGISVLASGLRYGQPTGILLLATVALATSYRARSERGVAGWLAVSAVQPHIALAGGLALLIAGGRWTFRPLLVAAAIVALLSAFTPRLDVEYLAAVLPAHAAANILDPWQFAIPSALAQAGVAIPLALRLGALVYAAAIAGGIALGAMVARRTGRAEALPWVATLFGTIGAPHVHYQQLAAVLPAAFLLISVSAIALPAIVCAYAIAIPWGVFCTMQFGWAFPMLPALGAFRFSSAGVQRVVAVALLLLAVQIAVTIPFNALYHPEGPFHAVPLPPNALAEESWAAYTRWEAPSYTAALLAAKCVTWLAELGLVVLCVFAARAAASARAVRTEPAPASVV